MKALSSDTIMEQSWGFRRDFSGVAFRETVWVPVDTRELIRPEVPGCSPLLCSPTTFIRVLVGPSGLSPGHRPS